MASAKQDSERLNTLLSRTRKVAQRGIDAEPVSTASKESTQTVITPPAEVKTNISASKSIEEQEAQLRIQAAIEEAQKQGFGFSALAKKGTIQRISIYKTVPAPKEWNKYPLIRENNVEEHLKLKLSILKNGLLEQLKLWEQQDGTYMILAGHNRITILMEICDEYPEFAAIYDTQECKVYGKDEITDAEAFDIINHTNIYRNFDSMPRAVQLEILSDIAASMMDMKLPKGESVAEMSARMGIKKSKLYELQKIRNYLHEDIKQNLFFQDHIGMKQAVLLADLDKELQEHLVNTHMDEISNETIKRIDKKKINSKDISLNERKRMLDEAMDVPQKEVKTRRVAFSIPTEHLDEIVEKIEHILSEYQ